MVQLAPPIFLSVELTRSFLHEYPKCSAKNVVLPYPIPGRDWHNGAWRRKAQELFGVNATVTLRNPALELGLHAQGAVWQGGVGGVVAAVEVGPQEATAALLNKPIFTYYSGGNHGCTNVRIAIAKEVDADPR
jgi:hypothetical protein